MNAIEILRAASRSVPNEDYVQFMAAVEAVAELIEAGREVRGWVPHGPWFTDAPRAATAIFDAALARVGGCVMDAASAYEKFRETVRKEAAKLTRPLEVSQSALWAKSIAVEAFAGKHDELFTFTADGKFGFSERLVNQCIEYAMQSVRAGRTDEEWRKEEFERGYDTARREFAKATGLYTDEDIDDGRY